LPTAGGPCRKISFIINSSLLPYFFSTGLQSLSLLPLHH
jgi:hypothetical protein